MKRSEINDFIRRNYKRLSDEQLAAHCGLPSADAVEHRRRRLHLKRDEVINPRRAIEEQTAVSRLRSEATQEKKKVAVLIEDLERVTKERDAAFLLKEPVHPHIIKAVKGSRGEATMVALLSDWHVEEEVKPAAVNGLNTYRLDIARQRADHYFATLLRLIQIEQQNTQVDHLILALLGDFISGDIHEEIVELAQLQPAEAIRFAQELLVSGIEYLLEHSDLTLSLVCHSGNHGRTTKEQRHATEHGHSLEWLMYKALEDQYADNKRVRVYVPESYHHYAQVYDYTIRFHHGHAMNYGGGVGGITIPVRKAIAQWNTLRRADLDCFGHFHQAQDGGNFIANGSMIGYNGYALAVKAGFEPPMQMLFGIHSKHGLFITRRIRFPI